MKSGESVDSTKYRGMIGSLLYLTASRPDIMFSVCLCARFQEAPKTSHLEAVKRIFRYIKGTTHLGLWYPKGTDIETVVYADSDHAGDYVDRKSTSGICTFVGCCLTSWFSKKQTALAISTNRSGYVSAEKACQEALWMKQALIDYDGYSFLCPRGKTFRRDVVYEKNVVPLLLQLPPSVNHLHLIPQMMMKMLIIIKICLGVDLEPDEWIKDSGCSKHMTGNQKLFSTYKAYNGGNVIFGSNLRGNIIGKCTISNDSLKIDNVEHVDNLGFNLLSIGQICDNKCKVTFSEHDSEITKNGKVIGRGIRKKGLYVMKLGNKPKDQICLTTIDENSTLWHRRLGHANMRLIQSLASKELVRNLPKLKFDQHFCDACKMGKQAHASHKAKNVVSTTRCLELLHMDLFGPSAVRSYGGNRYTLVIVDDYSRYTWTRFLKDKTEAFDQFEIFSKKIQNQLGCTIVSIRTDHGREFDNEVQFGEFCNANGITHNFSAPRTPQINGVVERKIGHFQKMKNLVLTCQDMCDEFAKIMHEEFKMSMMGELNFFLGLQIKQMKDGILFNQSKYIKEMLKKFGLEDSKPMKTPMSSDTKLTKDEECESVDSTKYQGMIVVQRFLCFVRSCHESSCHPTRAKSSKGSWHEKRRPLHSSSTFDQPSSSHLNDDDDDENNEGTSRASTPSPIHYVNSLTNQVPQVFQNLPNIDPNMEPFYTRQTEIINRQVQLRDEQRGGLRSIRKGFRKLWKNLKKM
ncbi:retrovirus-related pol polyprotein from transposon TNT 1-94 [Tanacetum coccineum]